MKIKAYFVDKGFSEREAQMLYDVARVAFRDVCESTEALDVEMFNPNALTVQYPFGTSINGEMVGATSYVVRIAIPMRFNIRFWYHLSNVLMVDIRGQYHNWDATLEDILNEAQ